MNWKKIVVTATRRSEALSKVPISVTAINQEALDAHGMKDFQDIARFTPGVTIDSSITNAISIRGISSSGGAGTTGIYIDDTPIQMRSVGFNPDDTLPKTFDLDRVEVLRGPQGTLFGAGSEGGTVRYILTAPKLHGSSTYVRSELSTTTGGQPSYELGVAHGTALIDGTLGVRMSAWYRNDGGWIDRVDPTTRVGHRAQRESCRCLHGAARCRLAADGELHHHAQHRLPEEQPARRVDLLAGLLEPERRPVQQCLARTPAGARQVLPAGAQARVEPGAQPGDLEHLLLLAQRRDRLPGHGLRPELLPGIRLGRAIRTPAGPGDAVGARARVGDRIRPAPGTR